MTYVNYKIVNFLEFTTLSERIFVVPFLESEFFDWIKKNGYMNLKIGNQVCLYINGKHHRLMDIEHETVQSVRYNFSEDTRNRYHLIVSTLEYNV